MRLTRAIVRDPADTFALGITASNLGPPDLALAREQHDRYCRALVDQGLSLLKLPPDPNYPDSTFVEDPAVATSRGATLTRPGAASRLGEVAAIRAALQPSFPELSEITSPATVDGGDVCDAGGHFFIGLSQRTNPAGVIQVAHWLARLGWSSSTVDIRRIPGLLHLKTGLSWLGGRTLLAVSAVAEHEALSQWEVVRVPEGEEYAANCIRVNDALLVPDGSPGTHGLLLGMGYDLVPLAMSEFRKMDGGPSCLSLRW